MAVKKLFEIGNENCEIKVEELYESDNDDWSHSIEFVCIQNVSL